jgi:hypothetical protein
VEISRIGADVLVPGRTEAAYIDLGGLTYENTTLPQKALIGDVASWVAHVRSAYRYNPERKTVIKIDDFLRDSGGGGAEAEGR